MRSAFVLVLAAALSACAGRAPAGQPAPPEPVSVLIENRNWATVNVFAVRDGSWSRLGVIQTNGKERARLPSWALSGTGLVRLKVETIGTRETYITDPILAASGQEITLYVQPALRMTSWMVQ